METMNLPNVLIELVKAQNNHNSTDYANCFSETAMVIDEGRTYNGRNEIKQWIKKANDEFEILIKPVRFAETETKCSLTAEVSGTFDGSPVLLDYHFEITANIIDNLEVTVNTMQ
jgi:hypothetical protein